MNYDSNQTGQATPYRNTGLVPPPSQAENAGLLGQMEVMAKKMRNLHAAAQSIADAVSGSVPQCDSPKNAESSQRCLANSCNEFDLLISVIGDQLERAQRGLGI